MQTVKVTVNVFDQAGVPIAGARVTALLTGPEVAQGYVLPVRGDVVANADGVAVLDLFPNAAGATQSMYLFRIQEPKTGRVTEISATIPSVDCYLHDVANLPPYEGKRDGQLAVDAAVSALAHIRGIALEVTDQATLATQKAEATASDRDAVAQLSGQVQTDKSATSMALQSAEQAAQVAADQATLATQKAEATASDRDAVALLAGQVQTDKSATGTALQSAQQAAQVASDQATLATQKAVATAADRDAVTQTASQVALNKAATDTNLAASQLALQTTQTQTAVAGTSSVTAVSARDQAVAARDLSVAAWAASMSPAETLPAISKLMHSGAVVKALIYDTSRDSDGGQWRKRCAGKSWYTESINGAWLGQAATAAAAWAISGAVTGAYFQNTTDGKFYTLGAASPAVTETLRGNAREFPEQVAIIVESGRIVIYDLTQPTCPMWVVFSWALGGAFTSVAALNGALHVGSATGLIHYHFIRDAIEFRQSSSFKTLAGLTPANRSGSGTLVATTNAAFIVNNTVNDVAVIVLENSPFDLVSGHPSTTIAVATGGGISVINASGTVVNSANIGSFVGVAMDTRNLYAHQGSGATNIFMAALSSISAGFTLRSYSNSSVPAIDVRSNGTTALSAVSQSKVVARGCNTHVAMLKENESSNVSSMVAYLSSVFNTGWMVGDCRGCWLAEVLPDTLSPSGELVTNGTNPVSTSGWTTAGGTSTLTVNGSNQFVASSGSGNNLLMGQAIATTAGRAYQVQFTKFSTENLAIYVGPSFNNASIGSGPFSTGAGVFSYTFVATGPVSWVQIAGGGENTTGTINNISCKLVVADRSVKNNPLAIVGSVLKQAVAYGAALQFFSGFLGSGQYLEQPYNAGLDFGTGDFHVSAWENNPIATNQAYRFCRGTPGVSATLLMYTGSDYFYRLSLGGTAVNTGVLQLAGVHKWDIVRAAGVLTFYLDGVAVYSVANTVNISNATAVLRVGTDTVAANWAGVPMALLRMSATAPSADQIAKMYADELPLFQPNAQCTIDGTSSSVKALAYDDVADLLHVGTSWGRSSFRGLARVESEATTVGAITSLSGNQGARLLAGATGCRAYQPAMLLRDELRREEVARRALGQKPQFFEYDAIAAQTAFVVPKGYTVKAVYSAGVLQREGSTKSYTRAFDGFSETINFAVAPGAAVWVSIMCVRSA